MIIDKCAAVPRLAIGIVCVALVASPAAALDLHGAGATFPAPLYEQWIADYAAANPDTHIAYDVVGSGEGVRRFIDGTVDFAASDAAMTDEQIDLVKAGVELIPATAGMVVLAYNIPDVPTGLRLTRGALAGIFLGEVRQWNDPLITSANPGVDLPKLTIMPIVRRDGSGTTFAFTNHLSAINDLWQERYGAHTLVDWPGLAMSAVGNEGVAGRINLSWGSLGYVEQGFASRLGLPVAAIENAAGNFILPSATDGQAALDSAAAEMPDNRRQFIPDPPGASAYPIVTYSWLLLYGSYAEKEIGDAVRDFARYGLTDGQAKAAELGYIPLPRSVAERGLAALGAVN